MQSLRLLPRVTCFTENDALALTKGRFASSMIGRPPRSPARERFAQAIAIRRAGYRTRDALALCGLAVGLFRAREAIYHRGPAGFLHKVTENFQPESFGTVLAEVLRGGSKRRWGFY